MGLSRAVFFCARSLAKILRGFFVQTGISHFGFILTRNLRLKLTIISQKYDTTQIFMANLSIVLTLLLLHIACARHCSTNEFNYEYTQCDGSGERWRVAIPKNHGEVCDNAVPAKSVNCCESFNRYSYLIV